MEVRELLRQINREHHTSIFISSHILDELSKIADTIGIIDHGSMLAEISTAEIAEKGMNLETYYLSLLGGGGNHACEGYADCLGGGLDFSIYRGRIP